MDLQEPLPPGKGGAAQAEPTAPARAVHHMAQAHPNNLVDPWWMNEALVRDYSEIVYKEWPLDIDDVDPAYVDEHLPDGVGLVRRSTWVTSRKVE